MAPVNPSRKSFSTSTSENLTGDLCADDLLKKLQPSPVLRLHLDELTHPATATFLKQIPSTTVLTIGIKAIIQHLYLPLHFNPPNCPHNHSEHPQSTRSCPSTCIFSSSSKLHINIPATRSVTLILRSMDGVAYTSGIPLDAQHKEMHLSLTYLSKFSADPQRFTSETTGVLTHELVHCYQHDARGTCPGGLIEGIADYVRLKAGLAPPHWDRREKVDRWDEGYQRTAWFLEWLEEEYGYGTVARINAKLGQGEYHEEHFWPTIFGQGTDVKSLFKRWRDSVKENKEKKEDEQEN